MTELLLIRHAVNDFVKTGKLAGWTPGVHLNEHGFAQAEALGVRLANTKIDVIYSSPLERTVETAQAVIKHHPHLTLNLLEEVGEVRFGEWQGAELRKLFGRKQWRNVQAFPSRVRFPNGETLREAQLRAIDALENLVAKHPRARVAVVSHSDIIRLVVSHYLGMHIDMFQRVEVSPASLTVISMAFGRPTVLQVNETSYLPEPKKADGSITEIRPVNALTVDAIGAPGERAFFFQAVNSENKSFTLAIEKTQAMILAEEISKLLSGLGESHPHLNPADSILPSHQIEQTPQDVMFRGGKLALQYEEQDDSVKLEFEELLGAEQGTPRVLRLWASRGQMRGLADHAHEVVSRGR